MNRILPLAKQFIQFGIVGISNTLISLSIYYLFILINMKWYLIGNTVGFIISVANSYYWNNKYVFKAAKRNHIKALLRTYLSYGVTFLLGTVLLYIMIEILGIPAAIAPILNLCITVPPNFLLNKFWAFKVTEEGSRTPHIDSDKWKRQRS